jgi:hypothetical protein
MNPIASISTFISIIYCKLPGRFISLGLVGNISVLIPYWASPPPFDWAIDMKTGE